MRRRAVERALLSRDLDRAWRWLRRRETSSDIHHELANNWPILHTNPDKLEGGMLAVYIDGSTKLVR